MRSPVHLPPVARNIARPLPTTAAQSKLERAIEAAAGALLARQRQDGHWVFELEADATISAEYILLQHFLGEGKPALEAKIASYLRRRQGTHGGWPLFHGGEFNLSASVKAYFALKVAGDSADAEHMRRAREAILAHGGAGKTNVFTRVLLALFGVISWRSIPVIPVEVMLLPRWFPFHLSRISYWSRTVLVPLLVLAALKPSARNPQGTRIDELFPGGRPRAGRWARAPHQSRGWFIVFASVDAILRLVEPWSPRRLRRRAIAEAAAFVTERLNGEDGLGAIFPAMANTVMMLEALGYPRDDRAFATARKAIDGLLVVTREDAYCQPCVSPVWDTVLACHALLEVAGNDARAPERGAARRGLEWLEGRQVFRTKFF